MLTIRNRPPAGTRKERPVRGSTTISSMRRFRLRARATSGDEMGTLAAALNTLSADLDHTLGDLTRERDLLGAVLHAMTDGVLVSDVGKPIEIQSNRRAGGLIRTALRATDILMDRVWQLENETFEDTAGFVFARITRVVEPKEDPTALHPEIQRHDDHAAFRQRLGDIGR